MSMMSTDSCRIMYFCDEVSASSSHQFCPIFSPQSQSVLLEDNAGGSSEISEAISAEYMVRRFDATNLVTEMRVRYWNPNWKKVDYICSIYGSRIGVSVTRAMGFPNPSSFSSEDACHLLRKKIFGLVVARAGVEDANQRFNSCILHVWCQTKGIAKIMMQAIRALSNDPCLADNGGYSFDVGDVKILLTVAGDDVTNEWIFKNKMNSDLN